MVNAGRTPMHFACGRLVLNSRHAGATSTGVGVRDLRAIAVFVNYRCRPMMHLPVEQGRGRYVRVFSPTFRIS